MKDDQREDARIGVSLETLARHILETPRNELAALRAAFDRQVSSIEARLEATTHKPALDAAAKIIAESIRERVDRAQQQTEADMTQALAGNMMLRKALDNAQHQLASAQDDRSTAEADRKAIAAQHKEALTEKKKLTASLDKLQAQLVDAQAQLKRSQQEVEEFADERLELQRKLKDAIAAKAVADSQYQQLVAASQKLTDGLSRALRPAPAAPPKRSEQAEHKAPATATATSKSAPASTPPTLKSAPAPTPPVSKSAPAPTPPTLKSAPAPASPPASHASAKKKPLQFPGPARDAKRVALRRGTQVNIDGIPGELVDLSLGGAQALLRQMVKPNQPVRLTSPTAAGQLICKGRIVWVVYEQPETSLPVYRVGMKFNDADSRAVEDFMRDFSEEPLEKRPAEIA